MKRAALIVAGNFLLAAAAFLFIEPSGLLCGGTTGIALFVKSMFHVPLAVTVLIFNILMLGLAFVFLGPRLAGSAIVSSLLYPFCLQILTLFAPSYVFSDPWINVLFGGGLMGFGIGTVLCAGASSGGIDIPALILNPKVGVSVSAVLYSMDMIILALQLVYAQPTRLPYSIVMVLLSSTMVNVAMTIGKNQIQATIISNCPQILVERIQKELKRGATYLQIVTGYRLEKTQAVFCTISARELSGLKNIVREEDPEAFMTFVTAKEVQGRGFTLKKE